MQPDLYWLQELKKGRSMREILAKIMEPDALTVWFFFLSFLFLIYGERRDREGALLAIILSLVLLILSNDGMVPQYLVPGTGFFILSTQRLFRKLVEDD